MREYKPGATVRVGSRRGVVKTRIGDGYFVRFKRGNAKDVIIGPLSASQLEPATKTPTGTSWGGKACLPRNLIPVAT